MIKGWMHPISRGSLRTITWALLLAALLLSPQAGRAQTTSAISGTVTDATGAAVPAAIVTATNTGTGIQFHTIADSTGIYHITQLPPGSYSMVVTSAGFSTQDLQSFPLLVAQQSQQNFTLTVGKDVQSVTVSSASLLIETEDSTQGQVIGRQTVEDLPLNGRNYLQLAQLSAGVTPILPGVSSPASQFNGSSASPSSTATVAIAGLREDDNSFLYDGIETRNAWYGAEGILPSLDNVQEFKVEQSGAPANLAAGGAFISIVTRSGTNNLHGSVFEFLRNNDFDARNYFDQGAAPPFHQNQFGAFLGGPVKRNKAFFFLNYEGFRLVQPLDTLSVVPTQAQLSGDFSSLLQGPKPVQLTNPFTNVPYANNQVPTTTFNPVGRQIAAYYPLPNGTFAGNTNYFNVSNTTQGRDQESGRFDYSITPKDNAFFRFTFERGSTAVGNLTPSRAIDFPSNPKNLVAGWTHVFSPNLVNDVRYGWTHTQTGNERSLGFNPAFANPLGLLNEADQPGSYGPPAFNVAGHANPGSSGGTTLVSEGLNEGTENVTIQKGKHQISAGVDIRYAPIFLYEDWAATNITFNGNYTGDPVADLLLGVPTSAFTAIGDPTLNLREWYQAYYVSDSVKLNSRLNVTAGLNYSHISQPYDTRNRVGSFDVANGRDLSYPDTNALGLTRSVVKPKYLNFAPRLGFNFLPFADGKTDVKGGFGIFFIQPNLNQYEVAVDTTQFYLIQSYNNRNRLDATGKFQGPSFAVTDLFGPNVPGGGPTASFIQPDGKTPYTYEWNLTLDRTIKSWLFEAVYLGSAAHHFEERPNIAPLINGNGDTRYTFTGPDGKPVTPFNGVQENTNSGSSFYSGIVARVEHRYSSGFEVLGNYTFSKCLGYPYQDRFTWHPLNLRLDRGHCDTDLNHNFIANAIYELPFGKDKPFLNHNALVNAAVGGWRLSVISSIHSGPWFTLGSNQNLGIFVNGLPDVTGPVNNSALHGGLGKRGYLGPYFNTQNVVPVTDTAVQGNASVQQVISPGAATWDLSGYKSWTYAERYVLNFQADAFNIFNRVNFNGLDTGVNDPQFGRLQSASASRQIQLGLRFKF